MTTFTEKPTAITPNRELQSDEYFNETNHLIYCSKCNTPRQCRHELQGKVLIPSIRCKCQQEIFEQEEAQRKLHEKQMEIEHLKTSGLQDKSLYDYTFAKDNGSNPEMKLAHNYVSNWEEMKANASHLGRCRYWKIFLCRLHCQCPSGKRRPGTDDQLFPDSEYPYRNAF